jgi:hypothetical protein
MQIVSGDITRDITGEIVYLKAYKQMVGEVTGYSTEKGTATVKLCDTELEITVIRMYRRLMWLRCGS